MSILRGVLEEEYKRLKSLLSKYNHEISKLPPGSVSIKEIAGHSYAYLVRRKNGKIEFQYIGRASDVDVKRLRSEIKKRKEFEGKRKTIKKDIREMERALGGRKI